MTGMELIKKYEEIYGAGSFERVFSSDEKELRRTMEELQSIIDELKEIISKTQTSSDAYTSKDFPDFEDTIIECLKELGYHVTSKDLLIEKGEMHADEDGFPTVYAEVTIELLLKVKISMSAIHHNTWDIYIDEVIEFV